MKNADAHNAANKDRILDLGLRILLVIVFLYIVYYFFNQTGLVAQQASNYSPENTSIAPTKNLQPTAAVNQFEWKVYESKEFGFSMRYPASLSLNELGNTGGYIDFLRFEEEPSLNLTDKGVAVGVSSLSAAKEIVKIKKQVESDGGAILADESQTDFKEHKATRLYYKPVDSSKEEERIIIIVNIGNGYTYSVSTTPDQMPQVIEGFNFINN